MKFKKTIKFTNTATITANVYILKGIRTWQENLVFCKSTLIVQNIFSCLQLHTKRYKKVYQIKNSNIKAIKLISADIPQYMTFSLISIKAIKYACIIFICFDVRHNNSNIVLERFTHCCTRCNLIKLSTFFLCVPTK